jgi:hypothetical protein
VTFSGISPKDIKIRNIYMDVRIRKEKKRKEKKRKEKKERDRDR